MDFELLLKKCPLLTRIEVLDSMASLKIKASNKIFCVVSVENYSTVQSELLCGASEESETHNGFKVSSDF